MYRVKFNIFKGRTFAIDEESFSENADLVLCVKKDIIENGGELE